MKHDHCWHDNGVMLLSMPPQQDQVCCDCGAPRRVWMTNLPTTKTHGPYLPNPLPTLSTSRTTLDASPKV